jgi:hypothetical protein
MAKQLSATHATLNAEFAAPTGVGVAESVNYEQRLDHDTGWALLEGSRYFEGEGSVHHALRKITSRLRGLGIDYAVIGGMALFYHGFRRFTEDIDLLVTRESLQIIHRELQGLGYRPVFHGSKNLRDTETGVRIEFLVAGQYPGDGRQKPVAFPDPAGSVVEYEGIQFLDLDTLIELKLASGMSSAERLKDLVDVQELIRLLDLPLEYQQRLHPFVRTKFEELWQATRPSLKRYVRLWSQNSSSENPADLLQQMLNDGIVIEGRREPEGHLYLVTTDPGLAGKYDMHDEAEFLDSW